VTGHLFDAVLCDIDGVVRHWPPDHHLEARFGLPAGTVAGAAFAPARLWPALTGQVTDGQWREAVAMELAAACGSLPRARELVTQWGSVRACRVDRVVVDLLIRARRHVPVVLVSNATDRLEDDLDALGLLAVADAVVNSSRVGAAKPDPLIYRAAAVAAGVPASRCLFIDDSPGNVAAARAEGMAVLLYRNAEQLRTALVPLGLRD
jgi:putative hydrolase of the HAD superfamily